MRQSAFHDDTQEPTLGVRFLHLPTIPSDADASSVQLDDDEISDPENENQQPPQQEEKNDNMESVHLQNPIKNSANSSSPKSKSKPP